MPVRDLLNAASGASAATYIEDVFSTYLYTGNGSTQSINNGIDLNSSDENAATFTTPGTYSWTCPAGVTSVSVVCVGGGGARADGSSGGGLGYKNNISVTPGNSYTVVVGSGGVAGTTNGYVSNGTDSYFINTSTVKGGGATGTAGGTYTGDGGGNGGNSGYSLGGGAGAGGYSGNGGDGVGNGGSPAKTGNAGSGGGGGSGGTGVAAGSWVMAAAGGGVGIFGQGASGSAGPAGSFSPETIPSTGGGGGSGGTNGQSTDTYSNGGTYGGGGGTGGRAGGVWSGAGGGGAVRIVWPGATRQFPSTNVTAQTNSTKGGLVWVKARNQTYPHLLTDSSRGTSYYLNSNTANAQSPWGTPWTFNSNGFTDTNGWSSAYNLASWTFRKQPKFFDVVTYTGNGAGARAIAHSLGSVPGMTILKKTSTTSDWIVNDPNGVMGFSASALYLNNSNAKDSFNQTGIYSASSTTFSVGATTGSPNFGSNDSGVTYVAYLFAHNAGGFGTTGSDNVISCGSYTGTGANVAVTLGWEPQYLMVKRIDSTASWYMQDIMRGMSNTAGTFLQAQSSSAESASGSPLLTPTATGFNVYPSGSGLNASGGTYIYIAIRRPMKVPTDATTVFQPVKQTFSGTTVTDTGFVVDMVINKNGVATNTNNFVLDRLRGSDNSTNQQFLLTNTTNVETASSGRVALTGTTTIQNGFLEQDTTANNIVWSFSRRPGFFDEVICTQTGSAQDVTHNLGVAPELLILKDRTSAVSWQVGTQFTSTTWNNLVLNSTAAGSVGAYNNYINAQPTSTVFRLGPNLGSTGDSFVAYLFATCPGVSKVGSYTGTGATQTINCGFTGGARFVLIKRTDSTGDWYVWDTARGMVSGTDPSLLLNSTNPEVNANSVYTATTGFQIVSTAAGINASGGSYIFLAIA
jgi:hypothetical protein